MKKQIAILFTVIFFVASCNEKETKDPTKEGEVLIKPISSYFPQDRAKVLVVGTFHFDYPGLDALEAAEEDKIDVLREPKKSEVTGLVEYLKKFKPNKIAIEAHPGWNAGGKFREYKAGEHRDRIRRASGTSRSTAAHMASVPGETLGRWLILRI